MNEPRPPLDSSEELSPSAAAEAGAVSSVIAHARTSLVRVIQLGWVPVAASLVSLLLSIAAIVVSTRQPEVLLILPDQIRVAQGRNSGSAFVYLQPAFVSTGRGERVEMIRDMSLIVRPPSGDDATFVWDEQVELVPDPGGGGLSYRYVADAVPILVGPRTASAPLSLFDAPDGWRFRPGEYTFTLTARRVVVSEPLRSTFTIAVSADHVAFLDAPGPERFLALPLQ